MTDQRLRTVASGVVPGLLIGVGGGVLLAMVAAEPGRIAAFLAAVGALAVVLGGLAWAASGSLSDSLGDYATEGDFGAGEARQNALRLAGLGVGLVVGGAVVWVAF